MFRISVFVIVLSLYLTCASENRSKPSSLGLKFIILSDPSLSPKSWSKCCQNVRHICLDRRSIRSFCQRLNYGLFASSVLSLRTPLITLRPSYQANSNDMRNITTQEEKVTSKHFSIDMIIWLNVQEERKYNENRFQAINSSVPAFNGFSKAPKPIRVFVARSSTT